MSNWLFSGSNFIIFILSFNGIRTIQTYVLKGISNMRNLLDCSVYDMKPVQLISVCCVTIFVPQIVFFNPISGSMHEMQFLILKIMLITTTIWIVLIFATSFSTNTVSTTGFKNTSGGGCSFGGVVVFLLEMYMWYTRLTVSLIMQIPLATINFVGN